MKKVLISILSQIMLILSVFGQQGQYRVFTPDTEISKGLIKAVTLDELGFVWFATDEGVVCFDGKQSVFYKNGLPGGYAKAFLTRKDGTLLVLHDLGLSEIISRPDTTEFVKILGGSPNKTGNSLQYPKTVYEDSSGNLWIGEDDSVVWISENKFKKYYFGENPGKGIIFRSFSFLEDENGNLWCFSNRGELSYFDFEKEEFETVTLSENLKNVNAFLHLGGNKAWVGTEFGAYVLELKISRDAILTEKISAILRISCAIITPQNELFFGTWENGLYRIPNLNDLRDFDRIEELPFGDVWGIGHDEKNGGFWIAGKEQVALIRRNLFTTRLFKEPNYFKSFQLFNEHQFVAVKGDELAIFEKNGKKLFQIFSFPVPVHSPTVGIGSGTNIWFGDLAGRLLRLDLSENRIWEVPTVKVGSEPIEFIYKDRKDNIWAGGNANYGLIRVGKSDSVHLYDKSILPQINIVLETSANELYIGGGNSKNYFFKYEFEKDKFSDISVPLPFIAANNFTVEDMIELPNGNIWLATFDGVLEYNPGTETIRQIDLIKVPKNEPANALLLSKDSSIWVSTTSGLINYKNGNTLLFNKTNGLRTNNISNRGLSIDNENNIWVATPSGLSTASLSDFNNRITPKPLFSKIKINGTQNLIERAVNTKLPAKHTLELDFISLSVPTDKVIYKTKILNRDSVWSEASGNTRLTVSGLSAGDYEVWVTAQQGGFLWSEPTSFAFSVDAPWYLKAWGMLLIGFGFLFVILGIARLYNLNLIKRTRRLEQIVDERTKEIKRQKDEIIAQKEDNLQLKEKQLTEEINYKNKQLTTYTLHFIQKNETLKELRIKIFKALRNPEKNAGNKALKGFLEVIDDNFRNDEAWKNFKLYFEEVHAGFFEKLKEENPALTAQDLRHCSLIRLNLSLREVATIMGISVESVKTSRFRLRKKMNIESQQELNDYIMTI